MSANENESTNTSNMHKCQITIPGWQNTREHENYILKHFQGGSVTLGCNVKEAGRPPASSFLWSVSPDDEEDGDINDSGDDDDYNFQ